MEPAISKINPQVITYTKNGLLLSQSGARDYLHAHTHTRARTRLHLVGADKRNFLPLEQKENTMEGHED